MSIAMFFEQIDSRQRFQVGQWVRSKPFGKAPAFDSCGPERVTGAWEGDRAYVGKDLIDADA